VLAEEASFSRTLGKGIECFKKLAAAAQVRRSYEIHLLNIVNARRSSIYTP
jgi:hypothetical protein